MKPAHRIQFLAALAAVVLPAGSLEAADVLFVDTAATVHASWQELIEGGGHTFTRFDTTTHSISLNNQASLDYVNSFDVIIISGSNALFNAIRAHGAVWNAQPTPMINLGNYLCSGQFNSQSWQWTTPGTGTTPNLSTVVDVLDGDDPIWTGVSLTPGTPPTVDLHTANAGHLTLGTNTFRPNITTVAAQSSNNGQVAIAYAAPEALRAGGGPQYFIASFTGNDGTATPFTPEGGQVFLNAIAALTGGFAAGQFKLTISQNGADFDFEWESQPGKLYDLLTSTDLATPIADWPVYEAGETLYEGIPSDGETTKLTAVPSVDPHRFFAMREYDAPPPPPLLFANFEENDGGFTSSTAQGSSWAWGTPESVGAGGTIHAGNGNSSKCWGTDIGNQGFYLVPTVTILRSPVIDLTEVTGATLSFAEALDLEAGDTAQVFLVNDDTNADIGGAIHTATDGDISKANWAAVGPLDIAAGAGMKVRLEWRFAGQAPSADFMGWYLDDVLVLEAAP